MDLSTPEVNYEDYLNSLIFEAMRSGHAVGDPEAGLTYLAVREGSSVSLDRLSQIREARVFDLNQMAVNANWMSYRLFTLLIREPEHLFAFLNGKLMLMVILNVEVLRKLVEEFGWQLSIVDDDGWSWSIRRSAPTGEERIQISRHFEGRIGVECTSLRWILQSNEQLFSNLENALQEGP